MNFSFPPENPQFLQPKLQRSESPQLQQTHAGLLNRTCLVCCMDTWLEHEHTQLHLHPSVTLAGEDEHVERAHTLAAALIDAIKPL